MSMAIENENNKSNKNYLWFPDEILRPVKELYKSAIVDQKSFLAAADKWDKFAPDEYKGILNANDQQ